MRPIPIDLHDPDADLAPFAVFDDLATRARVAYLVEMDHFTAEKSAFRLLCIRYLASRGWRWFGEEVDPRVGVRLDRYLTDGDAAMLDPIDEDPWYRSGILARSVGAHDDLAMQRDRARLMQAVRRAVPDARWFGFDIGGVDADYLAAANAANTYAELAPVMALRERKLHARVGEVLDGHPDDKVALMAGSLHLMKDDDLVDAPGVTGPGGSTVCSVGHHVAQELRAGEPVLAFWMLHGDGASANPYLPPPGALSPGKKSWNAELLRNGIGAALLRVDGDSEPRVITHMHNLDLTCRLSEQVDGIVWVPTVTPLPKV